MKTPRIALKTTDWENKSVRVYGQKYTISAEAVGVGPVMLILELNGKMVMFKGIERYETNPTSQFAGDLPPVTKSLGPSALSQATWLKIYRADQQRRSYYE